MDLLSALTELGVVFVVAGWVTYLQSKMGAPADGRAVAVDGDDEEGATPEQSDADQRR